MADQCLAAVPDVFNVNIPPGLEQYTQWVQVLEFPAEFGVQLVIPSSCFGSYRKGLLITVSWPVVLMLVACAACIVWEVAHISTTPWRDLSDRERRAKILTGFQNSLPLMLLVTFLLLPSVATSIFKTFLCVPFQYEWDVEPAKALTYRYLHDDLTLSCDSRTYVYTWRYAVFAMFFWPVGVPVVYAVVLRTARKAITAGQSTSLSRATTLLWADYKPNALYWEFLEMQRKLALTGWVLLINEDSEQARVLVALLVSISFAAIHLTIKPIRRHVASLRVLLSVGAADSFLPVSLYTDLSTARS
jgi:hypothetical protein